MQTKDQFVLGVNYWPRTKAVSFWRDFDAAEVRDDFALCADLGLNVIRLFLFWDDWQPDPKTVSTDCLKKFETVCDIANTHHLGLDVTFFTGHMSGPNWPPRWLLSTKGPQSRLPVASNLKLIESGYYNPFTYPDALKAEKLLLKTVVSTFAKNPAIWLWNLGNEPDLFAWPPDHNVGRAWVRQMTSLIHELDTDHPVTCGLHVDSLLRDNGLRVNEVYAETDVAVMHGYPMYVNWARDPLDPDFVPYTCALTSALCGKPTLAEEWGGCTTPPGTPSTTWEWTLLGQPRTQFMASEEALADYIEQVLPRLQEVGSPGAMLWCFADYAEELWKQPFCNEWRHERHFGMVRPDGSLKPHADVIKRFAATQPKIKPATRTVTLDVTLDEYYTAADTHAQRLYEAFVSKVRV